MIVLMTLVPGLAALELTRDARGRVTLSKQGNRIWRYGYDTRGRLSFVRDTLGRMTQLGYDDSDRLTSEVLPGGRTVGLGYDHRGNLTSVTPPGRPAHGYMYTKTELNRRYVPPALTGQDSFASRYEYNRDRQITRITRPDGSVVSLRYDATRARLDSVTVARGRSTLYYAASTGQLDGLSSPDGVTLSYGYNGPLPKSEQWSGALPGGVTHSISREHDRFFRDALVTVSGTPSVAYGYDDDGLLTVAGALSIHRRTDNGAIDSTYAPAGGGAIHSSVDYSPHGEVANLRYRHSSQGVLFQQSLVRDVLGRIVQLNEVAFGTSRVWGYRYDQAGRLYGVTLSENGSPVDTVARYLYDPNGNRVSFRGLAANDTVTATYDDQDRMLRLGAVQYEYTASGELRRKIEGGNSTWYRYDALGNLTSVLIPGGDSVSYVVDGVNRRVGRKWNGQWTGGWLYQDALRPAAELDAAGAVLNRYVYGADGQSPSLLARGSWLEADEAAGMVAWPHSGFGAYLGPAIAEREGVLRVARYCARAPVAESRLRYDAARAEVELVSDRSDGPYAGVHRMTALEFIARWVNHGALRGENPLRGRLRDAAEDLVAAAWRDAGADERRALRRGGA